MRTPTVSQQDVKREFFKVKELLPHLAELRRDDEYLNWYIGKVQIGTTAREARAFISGMNLGVRVYGLAGGE